MSKENDMLAQAYALTRESQFCKSLSVEDKARLEVLLCRFFYLGKGDWEYTEKWMRHEKEKLRNRKDEDGDICQRNLAVQQQSKRR